MSEPPIPPTEPTSSSESDAAEVPPPSPVEGRTVIDEALSFESTILAHKAVSVLATRIADQIAVATRERAPCTIYFLDNTLALALGLHQTFYQQCDVLGRVFDTASDRAERGLEELRKRKRQDKDPEKAKATALSVGGVVTAATGAVAVAANLLSYFNVDTSYFGREAEVGQQALVMELARRLLPRTGISFRCPSLGAASASVTPRKAEAPAPLHALNTVAEKQEEAFAAIHDLSSVVHQMADDDPQLAPARLALSRAHEAHDSAAAVFAELRETFLSTKGETGMSPAFLLRLASDVLQDTPADKAGGEEQGGEANPAEERPPEQLFLTARIETSGGSYRIRRHLFQWLNGEDPLTFTGGSIASFALLDADGAFLAAGTEWHREPFRNDAELRGLLATRETSDD